MKGIKMMDKFEQLSSTCLRSASVLPPFCLRKHSARLLHFVAVIVFLFIGGWNSEMWGAWSGSGEGTLKNGVWYVFYETSETSLNKGKSKECALSGPGTQLSFEAKRTYAGTGSITVSQDKGTTQLYSDNPGTSYGGCGSPYSLNVNSTKITFKNTSTISANTTKYVQNIKVTMAQYLNNPTKTDLDCGTADINSESTSGQVNVAWCNVPAMSYSIIDDADIFRGPAR